MRVRVCVRAYNNISAPSPRRHKCSRIIMKIAYDNNTETRKAQKPAAARRAGNAHRYTVYYYATYTAAAAAAVCAAREVRIDFSHRQRGVYVPVAVCILQRRCVGKKKKKFYVPIVCTGPADVIVRYVSYAFVVTNILLLFLSSR